MSEKKKKGREKLGLEGEEQARGQSSGLVQASWVAQLLHCTPLLRSVLLNKHGNSLFEIIKFIYKWYQVNTFEV